MTVWSGDLPSLLMAFFFFFFFFFCSSRRLFRDCGNFSEYSLTFLAYNLGRIIGNTDCLFGIIQKDCQSLEKITVALRVF